MCSKAPTRGRRSRRALPPPSFGLLLLALTAATGTQEPTQPAEIAAPAGSPATEPSERLTLEQAVRLALDRSPDLEAARQAAAAADAGIAVAKRRPDPELTVEAEKETPRESATLSVPVETGGKRSRRVELAEASARTAGGELARAEMEVRARVRSAFIAVAAAQRQAAERQEVLRLAGRLREAAQARLDAGAAPRLELVQAELTLSRAETEVDAASGAVAASRATLAALLGAPAAVAVVDDGDLRPLPSAPTLATLALGSSAELRSLDRELEEQTVRVELARAARVPDLTVDGAATHDSLPEFLWGWRAALSIGLPLFRHGRAEVEVEERILAQRVAEREAARQRIAAEVERQHALATAAERAARRYRDDVLPRAAEVEAMAEDSYRSGQTDLTALLLALQATRETRLQAIQAIADYEAAVADLEQAMGTPLP